MSNKQSWFDSYPPAASTFEESSIEAHHLGEVTGIAAREFGNRAAVSTQLPSGDCATLSYNDVDRLTSDFAVYLREIAGVQAGDVVALMSPNCIDFMLGVFGSFKAGCICTNINPLYTAPEMEHQLKDSGAKVLVIVDLFSDKVDAVIANTSVQQVIKISLLDFLSPIKKAIMGFVLRHIKKVVPTMRTSHVTMADALSQGAAKRRALEVDVSRYREGQSTNDIALYQYTGGTTGRSKGAELSHRNILLNSNMARAMVVDEAGSEEGDCALVVLPLYHITAFSLIMMPCIQHGTHCVMIPSPRPVSNLKPGFDNHTITILSGINTLYAALLNESWCTREALKHLRFCGSGGAAQRSDVAERWKALTGLAIFQGYGLTECSGLLTMNPSFGNRLGSVGIPIPGTGVRIVDAQGTELPAGEAGEVVAKGPTVMKGYLNRPEATEETIEDGWLHTGDIGVMDEHGYLHIVDRKKDMILVSGFNVFPNEIEDVIARLEGVLEVGVIGVPDEKTEEAIKAFVVSARSDLTAEQVMAHCAGSLTNYKRPKYVAFIEEIPKTPVGKVLRRKLRDMHSA